MDAKTALKRLTKALVDKDALLSVTTTVARELCVVSVAGASGFIYTRPEGWLVYAGCLAVTGVVLFLVSVLTSRKPAKRR